MVGDEKRVKPNPRITKLAVMNPNVVFSSRTANRESPTPVKAIPIEATIRGSILSESLPARGENKACTMGWDTKIKPALSGVSFFMYCK